MNQQIVDYFEQNKHAYAKEALITELRTAGHAEDDISEVANYVFGDSSSLPTSALQAFNFWDFKTKIIYQNSSQKWKDFLFGFFLSSIEALISLLIPSVGFYIPMIGTFTSLIFLIVEILLIFYFFKRRRYVSFGLLAFAILMRLGGAYYFRILVGIILLLFTGGSLY